MDWNEDWAKNACKAGESLGREASGQRLGTALLAIHGTSSKLGDAAAIVLPCRSSPSLFDPVLPALLPESDPVEHSKPRRCALPRSPLKYGGASWDQLYC
jgi:hypothetical protein